jgi:tetratricopeptide (TPR) repeat protein
VRDLFDAALEQPAAARNAWVAASSAPLQVQAEVLSLLAHATDAEAGGVGIAPALQAGLPTGADAGLGDRDHAPPTAVERIGECLGAWRIERAIGHGGMGEVYEARRADGSYDGRAAVKLLRRGLDSAAVLQRFALEQRSLARLGHPHIARLLDAGRSADGLPYFVMELVDGGQPIDRACTGRALEDRLALFLQLADAVAHAHRHLLVHRDLKPGNVLVTADGQVKLLDFGIAKALDPVGAGPAEGDDPHATQLGQRPYTPHYASPEQIRGEPVSTATDIYSLGVLLYQMLTGVRPCGRDATTPQAAARSTLEDEPTRPSSLSPELIGDPSWLATRRRLQGDLDNILLKALDKRPEARYASVEALAADVRAHLDGYPVSARAPRAGYLLHKFVVRNRAAVAAGALGLAGLLVGLAASVWQGHRATQARDEARQQLAAVKRITTDLVFRYGDTVTTLPGGDKAQEALLKETLASLQPALEAAPADTDLQALAASVLGRLSELQGNPTFAAPQRAAEARASVDRALALGAAAWPDHVSDWRFASWHLRSLIVLAGLQRIDGALQPALTTLDLAATRASQALALRPVDEGRAHLTTAAANIHLLRAQINEHSNRPSLRRPQEALSAYREAERGLRALLAERALLDTLDRNAVAGDVPTEVYLQHQIGTIDGGRALIHLRGDNLPAARQSIDAALVVRRANVARDPRNVVWRDGLLIESNTLAQILLRQGDGPAALVATTDAWRLAEDLARDQGPQSKWAGAQAVLAAQHGRALAALGRHAEALPVLARARQQTAERAQQAPDDPALRRRIAWLSTHQARSLAAVGRTAEARSALAEALASLEALTSLAAPASPSLTSPAGESDPRWQRREAHLSLAEACALAMTLEQRDAAALRTKALAALAAAAGLQALGQDHLRLRSHLQSAQR